MHNHCCTAQNLLCAHLASVGRRPSRPLPETQRIMNLLELQSKFAQDWFAAVDMSTRMMAQACETALGASQPRRVASSSAWPWLTWQSPMWTPGRLGSPWSTMPLAPWALPMTSSAWGWAWPTSALWQIPTSPATVGWPFALDFLRPPQPDPITVMQDAFATAYRSASGYATTAVLIGMNVKPKAPEPLQWPWQLAPWPMWGSSR